MDGGKVGEPLGGVRGWPTRSLRAKRGNPAVPKSGLLRCARNDDAPKPIMETEPASLTKTEWVSVRLGILYTKILKNCDDRGNHRSAYSNYLNYLKNYVRLSQKYVFARLWLA